MKNFVLFLLQNPQKNNIQLNFSTVCSQVFSSFWRSLSKDFRLHFAQWSDFSRKFSLIDVIRGSCLFHLGEVQTRNELMNFRQFCDSVNNVHWFWILGFDFRILFIALKILARFGIFLIKQIFLFMGKWISAEEENYLWGLSQILRQTFIFPP